MTGGAEGLPFLTPRFPFGRGGVGQPEDTMKENKYDDPTFFGKYSRMPRSKEGLAAAGEWHVLRRMLPPFEGKRVLDLGCGFGWHCRYAVEQGAASVVGVDLSERMLAEARAMTDSPAIQYLRMPIEAIDFPADSFDVAISSLAFHYIESFGGLCAKVNRCLSAGGHFVFSVEHPVFTAQGSQEFFRGRPQGRCPRRRGHEVSQNPDGLRQRTSPERIRIAGTCGAATGTWPFGSLSGNHAG